MLDGPICAGLLVVQLQRTGRAVHTVYRRDLGRRVPYRRRNPFLRRPRSPPMQKLRTFLLWSDFHRLLGHDVTRPQSTNESVTSVRRTQPIPGPLERPFTSQDAIPAAPRVSWCYASRFRPSQETKCLLVRAALVKRVQCPGKDLLFWCCLSKQSQAGSELHGIHLAEYFLGAAV